MLKLQGKRKLMRIFIGEKDRYEGKPLYKAIVDKCLENNIAGATVIRGIYGYGASSVIHSSKVLTLSDDLPLIVEIVDKEEKINEFLPIIDSMVEHGLITLELADVITYR
ncbi:DUF190 domain-containing protein [Deferribacterales bacterium Es71-Z0220]|jgi:PII-like signaling protein|uniref:DUF190 domain-containing protein n=1 Tax=Deferrivibrio essentukiensis TaxID=2880922 RepID=UPI001ED5FEA4|nr:DUF190 domain-containing protein [Deferrivibrio essentukiensis]MBZ4655841.1 hypothetical protein [Thermoanaerobacter sp.]MCB4204400.1 DUF190 domain-containing protein [Deferrivibrio essentukiensis]